MESGGTPGVGIRGMRERLRQLGGSLEIDSSDSGTLWRRGGPATGCPRFFGRRLKETL
jgi:signal transduction histidine kinase